MGRGAVETGIRLNIYAKAGRCHYLKFVGLGGHRMQRGEGGGGGGGGEEVEADEDRVARWGS